MKNLHYIFILASLILASCGGGASQASAPATEIPTVAEPTQESVTQEALGPCNPGTISVPDALDSSKMLVASNWIDWNDGEPVRVVVDSTVIFFYSWDEDSDTVSLKHDGSVIQTETIPPGASASFALSATSNKGTTMLRSIVIAHCGESSWSYSEDGKGEMRNIPNNSVQG